MLMLGKDSQDAITGDTLGLAQKVCRVRTKGSYPLRGVQTGQGQVFKSSPIWGHRMELAFNPSINCKYIVGDWLERKLLRRAGHVGRSCYTTRHDNNPQDPNNETRYTSSILTFV